MKAGPVPTQDSSCENLGTAGFPPEDDKAGATGDRYAELVYS